MCLHQFPRGAIPTTGCGRQRNLVACDEQQYSDFSETHQGKRQRYPGRTQPPRLPLQLEVPPRSVQLFRLHLGASRSGQVRVQEVNTAPPLQQSLSRHAYAWCGRPGTNRLGRIQQLGKPAIPYDPKDSKSHQESTSRGHSNRAHVGIKVLPQGAGENERFAPHQTTLCTSVLPSAGKNDSRAHEKSEVEDIRLEAEWESKLSSLGWSQEACTYYCKSLATSSIREYNRKLTLFKNFCTNSGTEDLSGSEAVGLIPSFLISVAKKSERPDSALRTCTAALQHFYVARANLDPINQNIHRLIKGLVRGETNRPREQTKSMPIEPFIKLFSKWGDNDSLPIAKLRQKAITLISLSALCRPSDLAPESIFKRSQIQFDEKGLHMTFFGIKNDSRREGFKVFIAKSAVPSVDPVLTLKCYLERTKNMVPKHDPVFVTVSNPIKQMSPQSVSRVLNDTIREAGLPRDYTARCFRVTGAQTAIAHGANTQAVKQLGRWRSEEVMWNHYCPITKYENITDTILFSNKS